MRCIMGYHGGLTKRVEKGVLKRQQLRSKERLTVCEAYGFAKRAYLLPARRSLRMEVPKELLKWYLWFIASEVASNMYSYGGFQWDTKGVQRNYLCDV